MATAVKSYVDVTDANYQLLGFLDAFKDLKQIPDIDIDNASAILRSRINALKSAQRQEMIDNALAYPPCVRALLGVILTDLNLTKGVNKLHDSMNPLTTFELGIDDRLLPDACDWNIQCICTKTANSLLMPSPSPSLAYHPCRLTIATSHPVKSIGLNSKSFIQ